MEMWWVGSLVDSRSQCRRFPLPPILLLYLWHSYYETFVKYTELEYHLGPPIYTHYLCVLKFGILALSFLCLKY